VPYTYTILFKIVKSNLIALIGVPPINKIRAFSKPVNMEIENQIGQNILTVYKQIQIDISILPSVLYFITFELGEK